MLLLLQPYWYIDKVPFSKLPEKKNILLYLQNSMADKIIFQINLLEGMKTTAGTKYDPWARGKLHMHE